MKQLGWKISFVFEVFLLTEKPLLAMETPLMHDKLSQIEKYGYQFGKLACESVVVMASLGCLYCVGKMTQGLIEMTIRGMNSKKPSYTDEDTPNNLNTGNVETPEVLPGGLPLFPQNFEGKFENQPDPSSNQDGEQKLENDNEINPNQLISGNNDPLGQAVDPSGNTAASLIGSHKQSTLLQAIAGETTKDLIPEVKSSISDDSFNNQNCEHLAIEAEQPPLVTPEEPSHQEDSNRSVGTDDFSASEPNILTDSDISDNSFFAAEPSDIVKECEKRLEQPDNKQSQLLIEDQVATENSISEEVAEANDQTQNQSVPSDNPDDQNTSANQSPEEISAETDKQTQKEITPTTPTTNLKKDGYFPQISSQGNFSSRLVGGKTEDCNGYFGEVKKLPSNSTPFLTSKRKNPSSQLLNQQMNQHQQLPSFEVYSPISSVEGGYNFFGGIGGSPVKRLPGLPG